jgi:hypothetical protein
MPALSYSKKNIEVYNFKDKIILNLKKHTIRRYGPGLIKRPFRVGDTLYHYENWRTPQVNKFHTNTCLWVAEIKIDYDEMNNFRTWINENDLSMRNEIALIRNDGFNQFRHFKNFFIQAGLPFHGQIIGWTDDVNYEERE